MNPSKSPSTGVAYTHSIRVRRLSQSRLDLRSSRERRRSASSNTHGDFDAPALLWDRAVRRAQAKLCPEHWASERVMSDSPRNPAVDPETREFRHRTSQSRPHELWEVDVAASTRLPVWGWCSLPAALLGPCRRTSAVVVGNQSLADGNQQGSLLIGTAPERIEDTIELSRPYLAEECTESIVSHGYPAIMYSDNRCR